MSLQNSFAFFIENIEKNKKEITEELNWQILKFTYFKIRFLIKYKYINL
jgi:hypothetical protein